MSVLAELFAPVLALALALAPVPAPMRVPDALLAQTCMPEPSGAVWSAQLARYLIVSDDTGDKARGTNHAPWLFAMGPDGALDPEPVPIAGIDKLNDAEALCAGPDGQYFLATSHAQNRKGQDRPERRRLLLLALDGRALQIRGALDLAGAIADAGVVPPGAVDIEGLAYRAGALYVGLKAPQTAAGGALVLRADRIERALQTGVLPAGDLRVFAEVPLRVDGAAGPVTQGVSDLSFLPDGSLVLLANSPKHRPADGGGALWQLRAQQAPRLLRRFPGLKPEGVTLTADRRALLIVFDRDRQPPLWLRQELPR